MATHFKFLVEIFKLEAVAIYTLTNKCVKVCIFSYPCKRSVLRNLGILANLIGEK